MTSLVEELQRDCIESEVDISNLLRKALVVAKKLEIKKFENWIRLELNGYEDFEQLPDYRKVSGELKGLNPYRGWQPILIQDEKLEDSVANHPVYESVTHLADLVERSKKNNSQIRFQLPSQIQISLMKSIGREVEVAYFIDSSQIKAIVDEVENSILSWALQLEEQNIKGENMSFSKQEKETAKQEIYNIFKNQGNLQLQQSTQNSSQTLSINNGLDFEKVKELTKLIDNKFEELKFEEKQREKISEQLENIKQELDNSNPNIGIIKEGLQTIRNIAEGIGGSLIASGIVSKIDSII